MLRIVASNRAQRPRYGDWATRRRMPARHALAASKVQRLCGVCKAALKLRLYTSSNCPLCEGLHSKVQAVIAKAEFMPSIWTDASLEVIDVETQPEAWEEYRSQVPVLLADLGPQQGWQELPRQAPRLSADATGKRLADALRTMQDSYEQ
eukprot:TRINITY_DN18826_c0_g1_i5.p2 TRINITY_DN18826_c0_g1~~TRINITY_DN18826_c0_g1_i5.p2  ORF type:complete len:150 (-),score=16.94 TRINITY_DN18826_c0_g1_i5:446-895(-)